MQSADSVDFLKAKLEKSGTFLFLVPAILRWSSFSLTFIFVTFRLRSACTKQCPLQPRNIRRGSSIQLSANKAANLCGSSMIAKGKWIYFTEFAHLKFKQSDNHQTIRTCLGNQNEPRKWVCEMFIARNAHRHRSISSGFGSKFTSPCCAWSKQPFDIPSNVFSRFEGKTVANQAN